VSGFINVNAQTLNATPLLIYQLPIPDHSTFAVTCTFVASTTATSGGALPHFGLQEIAYLYRDAGVATTVLSTPDLIGTRVTIGSASSWNAAIAANTTDGTLDITVTGEGSLTVNWNCRVEVTPVTA
jgi:hypothetical protein